MGGSGYLAKQKGDAAAVGTQIPGEAEKALRDGLIEVMRGEGGMEVIVDEEGQRVLDEYRELAKLMSGKGKKRTPKTASASENQKHRRTVVSSVEGAKIQKKLDSLIILCCRKKVTILPHAIKKDASRYEKHDTKRNKRTS